MTNELQSRHRRARMSVSTIFFLNGILLASWVSRIPAITDKLEIGSAITGFILMAMAIGAMSSFPLVGGLVARQGSGKVAIISAIVLIAALPFAGVAPHYAVLLPILFTMGVGVGGLEVSMNAQGVEVERFSGKNIMSSLHGCFSLGAFVGAGIGAGAAALEVLPVIHFLIASLVSLVVLFVVRGGLIPDEHRPNDEHAPTFALPPRAIWVLGLVAFGAAVGEGAMADWSGLYLNDHLGTSEGFAALGFASFQLAMLIGRFSGDALVRRFGPVAVVRRGGLLAFAGLAGVVAIGSPIPALIGIAIAGLGLAAGFPLTMSAAANRQGVSRGQSVAGVATIAYTGFLGGPPVLGWIAEVTSYTVLIGVVAVLCLMVALLANATRDAAPGHTDDINADVAFDLV